MVQILDGYAKSNDLNSYTTDIAVWRHCAGNYNFTDDTGAAAAYTIFTVTGDVMVQVFGLCQVALTSGGAATCELGITGNTAALIAQTAFDDIDQYETWQDAGPEANPGNVATAMGAYFVIANGVDVIFTIGAAALTAGDIDFHAFWRPLSLDGNLVAA